MTKEIVVETNELPEWQKAMLDNRLNRVNNPENYISLEDFIKELDQENEEI